LDNTIPIGSNFAWILPNPSKKSPQLHILRRHVTAEAICYEELSSDYSHFVGLFLVSVRRSFLLSFTTPLSKVNNNKEVEEGERENLSGGAAGRGELCCFGVVVCVF